MAENLADGKFTIIFFTESCRLCKKPTKKKTRFTVTADNIERQIYLVVLAKRMLNIDIVKPCFVCKQCIDYFEIQWEEKVSNFDFYYNTI